MTSLYTGPSVQWNQCQNLHDSLGLLPRSQNECCYGFTQHNQAQCLNHKRPSISIGKRIYAKYMYTSYTILECKILTGPVHCVLTKCPMWFCWAGELGKHEKHSLASASISLLSARASQVCASSGDLPPKLQTLNTQLLPMHLHLDVY